MKVSVSPKVFYIMWALTHKYDQEWGGFVTADYKYNGYTLEEIYIRNIYIPEQRTSGSECDFDQSSVNNLALEADDAEEMPLTGWIHSHVNMEVFWSGTDENCIRGLLQGKEIISLVLNKRWQSKSRYDTATPKHTKFDDLQMSCSLEKYYDFNIIATSKSEEHEDVIFDMLDKTISPKMMFSICEFMYGQKDSPNYVDIEEIIKTKFKRSYATPITNYTKGGYQSYGKSNSNISKTNNYTGVEAGGSKSVQKKSSSKSSRKNSEYSNEEEMRAYWQAHYQDMMD